MNLMDRQIELEQEMRTMGMERYNNDLSRHQERNSESRTSYGRVLIGLKVQNMAKAIDHFIKENTGKRGRKHVALKYLRMLPSDLIASITLRTIMDQLLSNAMLQKTAGLIGQKIEDEVRWRHYEEENKKSFGWAKKATKGSTSYRHTRTVMNFRMAKSNSVNTLVPISWDNWPNRDRLLLGVKLVEIAAAATKLVKVDKDKSGKAFNHNKKSNKSLVYRVFPTEETLEWIEAHKEHAEILNPTWMPCLVPPREWTTPYDGGYHTDYVPTLKLIKTVNDNYLTELEDREMPMIYETINALQNTGWKVNQFVLDTLSYLWKSGQHLNILPDPDDKPLPEKPELDHDCRDQWSEAEQEQWAKWRKSASDVHAFNQKAWSKRLQLLRIIHLAEKYKDEEAFYYPYQYDFRGRAYTVPAHFQPQGSDVSKGLLTFSEGKPIDSDEAEMWLAIHGSNVWGHDKDTLEGRHQWVKDNEEMIFAIAQHPLDVTDWADADKPWQFLGWCREWYEYRQHGRGYVSCLPVHMDGSCNGLQIFSIVLRHLEGAVATNCLPHPSGKPQDIYQIVADLVTEKLEEDAETGVDRLNQQGQLMYNTTEMAEMWLDFGIDRKCTKRPVMVLPYGGQRYSMKGYIFDYVGERLEKQSHNPFGEDVGLACLYLTDLVWDAIGETVTAARECMDWLMSAARVAASEGLPVHWETPDGFVVLQQYPDTSLQRITTVMGESTYKLGIKKEDYTKLDKRRQRNGISPNFVHSLDGCALRVSVHNALVDGINSFAMVHDSYGVPAADAARMASGLRRAFVDTFTSHDVLEDFLTNLKGQLMPEKIAELPAMPEKGELDVSQVLESPFFFA